MSENIFEFPYKVLTCLGLWAFRSKSRYFTFLYVVYQSLAFLYLIFFTSFLLYDLYSVRRDVHRASTNLSATISVLILLWKNTQGLQKSHQLRRLQRNLSRGLHSPRDEPYRLLLQKARREIKLACIAQYFLGFATMTAWVSFGLLLVDRDGTDNLPLPVFIPWDHHRSPYYELALAFQIYGGYFSVFDVLSFNLSIYGTILQICAEFDSLLLNTDMITEWYEKLPGVGKNGHRVLSEEENLQVKRMIVQNIQHHQKIIDCANVSENCYTHIMLVQFGGSAILLTFISLDLILVTRELNSRMTPLIIYLILATSDIYMFCDYGARLIIKSHELQIRLYHLPWEAMNPKNRRLISVMILKAQRPPKLTVEKFVTVDLYSLLGLTKIVYNVLYLLLHLARDR